MPVIFTQGKDVIPMRLFFKTLSVCVAILFVNCGDNQLLGPTVYNVEYKVTGSASTVSLTYTNSNGGASQESDVSVPWSYSFKGSPDDFVYISAQNQGDNGSVTVTIYKNGSSFKTSTSNGAYVIATASGSI